MQAEGLGQAEPNPHRRWVFTVAKASAGPVIRILDSVTGGVFRDVPVADFLAYARSGTDMRTFFFGNAKR
jgi:uncharacterized FlaG/YvyC family protein